MKIFCFDLSDWDVDTAFYLYHDDQNKSKEDFQEDVKIASQKAAKRFTDNPSRGYYITGSEIFHSALENLMQMGYKHIETEGVASFFEAGIITKDGDEQGSLIKYLGKEMYSKVAQRNGEFDQLAIRGKA